MNNDAEMDAIDRELKRQFGELRTEQKPHVPAFPGKEHLLQQVDQPSPAVGMLPRVAAGFVLIVASGLFFSQIGPGGSAETQDPAQIYAEIMNSQTLDSDQLLMVSADLMPAMNDLSDFYLDELGFEMETGSTPQFN